MKTALLLGFHSPLLPGSGIYTTHRRVGGEIETSSEHSSCAWKAIRSCVLPSSLFWTGGGFSSSLPQLWGKAAKWRVGLLRKSLFSCRLFAGETLSSGVCLSSVQCVQLKEVLYRCCFKSKSGETVPVGLTSLSHPPHALQKEGMRQDCHMRLLPVPPLYVSGQRVWGPSVLAQGLPDIFTAYLHPWAWAASGRPVSSVILFPPIYLVQTTKVNKKINKSENNTKEKTFFRLSCMLSYGNITKKQYLMTLLNRQDLLGNTTCL